MGEKASRKAAFLREHPVCCYCGGETVATTLDHNPARSFFPEGGGPRGFVFPACEACNSGKSRDESVAALVLNSFNIQEPIAGKHQQKTRARMNSFLLRDDEFLSSMREQFPGPHAPYEPKGFSIPIAYKLAILRRITVSGDLLSAISARLLSQRALAN